MTSASPAGAVALVSQRLASLPASVTPTGNSLVQGDSVSADGRYVLYTTFAPDVATVPDHNGSNDVFVRDVVAGTTTLVSVDAAGTAASNGNSGGLAISSDGTHVLFVSDASDLLPGNVNPNHYYNVYLRDLTGQTTTMVSVNSAGTASGNNSSSIAVMSADGSWVAFSSSATDLVASDPNGETSDVFLRDVVGGTTTLISVSDAPAGADADCFPAAVSDDGRYVLFQSNATNLVAGVSDGNGSTDVFLRDLFTGTTTVVSRAASGTATGNAGSVPAAMTPDGHFVLFGSTASDLVAGDVNGNSDVFRYDVQAGSLQLVSVSTAGTGSGGDGESMPMAITPDGRYVAFSSEANDLLPLDGDGNPTDTNGQGDAFVRDMQAPASTSLVSLGAAGNQGNAESSPVAISADGRYVLFDSSADNLVTGDDNGAQDVFLRDRQLGTTTLVSVAAGGGQPGDSGSLAAAMTADGRYVVLGSTADDLVVDDLNANPDVFERDLQASSLSLVSLRGTLPARDTGNLQSDYAIVGASSRFVALRSDASDLVAGDHNGQSDAFRRDLQTGTTQLASVNAAGTGTANGSSSVSGISGDGQRLLFGSDADDVLAAGVDTNANTDVFVRDFQGSSTILVSVATGGGVGNAGSYPEAITPNGRYVLFSSDAEDLVGNDGNGQQDVFVRDLQTNQTALVSVNMAGVAANGLSNPVAMTPNGRYVLFASGATDLTPLGTSGRNQQVYVRDLQSGTTTAVSVDPTGTVIGNDTADAKAISDDGRYVLFASAATNLGGSATGDNEVYLRDVVAGTTTLVSRNLAGTNGGNGYSEPVAMSSDGNRVLFASDASDLVANDGNGNTDVFLYDRTADSLLLISGNLAGSGSADGASYAESISGDGRLVSFDSDATDLVAASTNGQRQGYVRDLAAGTTTMVTATPGGAAGDGSSFGPLLNADGTLGVFGSTADDLVANDTNGAPDQFAVRFSLPLPFADGFETGDVDRWIEHTP